VIGIACGMSCAMCVFLVDVLETCRRVRGRWPVFVVALCESASVLDGKTALCRQDNGVQHQEDDGGRLLKRSRCTAGVEGTFASLATATTLGQRASSRGQGLVGCEAPTTRTYYVRTACRVPRGIGSPGSGVCGRGSAPVWAPNRVLRSRTSDSLSTIYLCDIGRHDAVPHDASPRHAAASLRHLAHERPHAHAHAHAHARPQALGLDGRRGRPRGRHAPVVVVTA